MKTLRTIFAILAAVTASNIALGADLALPKTEVVVIRGGDLLSTFDEVELTSRPHEPQSNRNFAGTWRYKMILMEDNSTNFGDGPTPWFDLLMDVKEERSGKITATISLDMEFQNIYCSQLGSAYARVDPKNSKLASGKMKMCWDSEYWPEFKLDFERRTGTATYDLGDGVKHYYVFAIVKIGIDEYRNSTGLEPGRF